MTFRSGLGARWLPRILGAAILVAALLATQRVDPENRLALSRPVMGMVVALGGLLALWIVRRGGEVRLTVIVDAAGLRFESGSRYARLEFADVERLRYEGPFALSRHWLPAAVLQDRQGVTWRIPATLAGGDRLLREMLRASGREDLAAWAETLQLERRMGRAGRVVALGYAVAAAITTAALAFYMRTAAG